MNERPPSSLLKRAQRQLWLLGLGLAALLIALAWGAWQYTVQAYAWRYSEAVRQHYANQLEFRRQAWQRAARRLRAQIEFMRLGELDAPARQAQLLAYFTAQGEERDFAGVLLLDAGGLPQFSLGCSALLQHGQDALQFPAGPVPWAYLYGNCADMVGAYVLMQTPLWLGRAGGKGTMIYAAAIDNALLARLARGNDAVYLLYQGRVVAASSGSAGLNDRIEPSSGAYGTLDGHVQVSLPLDATGFERDFALVVRAPFDPLLRPGQMAAATGLAVSMLLALIWLGLGRVLRRHLRRIETLSQGTLAFERDFRRAADWPGRLARERVRGDEIGQLFVALDRLMNEAEQRQREQHAWRQTLDMLDEVVLEIDADGRLLRASSAWPRVTGLTEAVAGQTLAAHLLADDAPAYEAMLSRLRQRESSQIGARLRLNVGAGEPRWIEVRLAWDEEGQVLRGVLRDVTQTYLQEQRIAHMALHDALTGLPNRVLLEDRLRMALNLARRSGHKVALGFIDLDHFKHVNDNLGHKTGDALLVALAQRLRHGLRSGDTLARWGGDEFIVLLPDLPDGDAAREAVAKLQGVLGRPLEVEGTDFNLTFSAGFALYPDDAHDGEQLLGHADRAMFHAKAQGRNAVQFYADMSRKGIGRTEVYIQQRLAVAVRERRILNHYQPLVEAKSRRPIGIEALARWEEPELGTVSPATFIPMAETHGLIRELGGQVWRRALDDAQDWLPQGIGLSVNVSKRELFNPDFARFLQEAVHARQMAPQNLTLEITESVAMLDVEHAFDRLHELNRAGFRLSIDDFGTGYSSLSLLHQLPVQELKIDREFVHRVHTPQGRRLIRAIVELAESLELTTVAEGVENAETADLLTELGVDVLQGWHFARAMPAEDLAAWLAQARGGGPV